MKYLNSIATASAITLLTGLTQVNAYDQDQYQAVKDGQKNCPYCDLSAADLTNIDFTGSNLSGADLTDANLTNGNLTKANLSGADLTRVKLVDTVLMDTNFMHVELDEVDLSGVDLTNTLNLDKSYCNWDTKIPENSDWVCEGVVIQQK